MTAKLSIWESPSDYAGFDPVGDICVLAKHRDSDALSRTNWDAAVARLSEAAGYGDSDTIWTDDEDRGPVYAWRAGHWAVGWVEYLMVRADAPQAVIDEAQAIADALEDYPALDEDAWSALEYEEACETWASWSLRERASEIKRLQPGCSIFAARRDELPQDDSGILFDMLRGC